MVISVSGPSFSGKTYLVAHLVREFPQLRVINYEKHWNKDIRVGYGNFFKDIDSHVSAGHSVICESVFNPETNPFVRHEVEGMINIVSLPDYNLHYSNYKNFLRIHGWDVVKRRLCGASIEHIRKEYIRTIPKEHIRCNGKNYKEIIEHVRLQCGLSQK